MKNFDLAIDLECGDSSSGTTNEEKYMLVPWFLGDKLHAKELDYDFKKVNNRYDALHWSRFFFYLYRQYAIVDIFYRKIW